MTMTMEQGSSDELAHYQVRHPQEVLRILHEVMQAGSLVSAYPDGQSERLLTTLVAVGADHLDLECGADAEMNLRLTRCRAARLVTQHGGVHLECTVSGLQQVVNATGCVLRAALPNELLRLQRRQYFRLTTSLVNPIRCHIHTGQGGLEATVIDLSVGGVGILAYPPCVPLEVGRVYEHCRLAVPGWAPFGLSLAVRSVLELTLRNGRRTHRAGCQFMALPPGMESELQRYILRNERAMRSRYL
ncbi:MAG: flagellar brake protein [Thiobacillaceae bacterium]|nr:flagellar brake protein [Thiobacillaceae bacterium]MDW8324652.1 flagellar regulator YcgR PilZN domain-containing protein [Burkholderiales bacterium]